MIARPGRAPLVYTPRAVAGCERMIEPGDRLLDRLDRRHLRQRRPAQHDRPAGRARAPPRSCRRSRCRRCSWRRRSRCDAASSSARSSASRERAAAGDIARVRHRERRLDRIDAADEIVVLRRAGEGASSLRPRRGTPGAARRRARCTRAGTSATSVQRSPAAAIQGGRRSASNRHAGRARGLGRIGARCGGVGMRGVDQRVDALRRQIVGEPLRRRRSRRSAPAPAARRAPRCGRPATASPRDRRARPAAPASCRASAVPPRMRIDAWRSLDPLSPRDCRTAPLAVHRRHRRGRRRGLEPGRRAG